MLMKLTWKLDDGKEELNVQVPGGQKIKDTLKIFVESGFLAEETFKDIKNIRSLRRKERKNINLTYEQGNIYPGDILYIES